MIVAVALDIDAMLADLAAFSQASKRFLADSSRLDRLQNQLASATAQARRDGSIVSWSTNHGGEEDPLRTKLSRDYRNYNTVTKQMFAEISFAFRGTLDPANSNRLIISGGKTSLKVRWKDTEDCTECHFDIHPKTAGHPMLHVQFVGNVREVPRIFSLLAHPLDVTEFALMEVFQNSWKIARERPDMLSRLQKYTSSQRIRLISTLQNYCALGADANKAPLLSLQGTSPEPLDFYMRPDSAA
jgi:hypothetical protein